MIYQETNQQSVIYAQNSQTAVDLQLKNFKGEAFNNDEKQYFLSAMKILSIIFILINIPLAFVSTIHQLQTDSIFMLIISINGGLMILLGILIFIWARMTSLKIFNSENSVEKLHLASNLFTQFIFILSILIAFVNLIILLFILEWNSFSNDRYIALNGKAKFDDFQQSYFYSLIVCVTLLSINQLFLCLFIYWEYVIGIGQHDLRIVAHFFNVLLIGFSLGTCWSTKQSLQYYQLKGMDDYSNKVLIENSNILSYVLLGLSIVIYITIIKKTRANYLIIGSLLFVLSCILTGLNQKIFRDAQQIREGFINSWNEQLPYISKDYVLEKLQCEKYIKKQVGNEKIYSLHCDPDFQTLIWEENVNLKVSERLYEYGCLNQDCKGVLADNFSSWFYRISLFMCCQSFCIFIIASVFYNISLIYRVKQNKMFNVDYFYGFACIVCVSVGVIYMIFYNFNQPPSQNQGDVF